MRQFDKGIPKQTSHSHCRHAEMILDRQLEQDPVSLTEDAFLSTHLMACPGCRQYEAELRELSHVIAHLEEQPIPHQLVNGIMSRIATANLGAGKLSKTAAGFLIALAVSASLIPYFAGHPAHQNTLALSTRPAIISAIPGGESMDPLTGLSLDSGNTEHPANPADASLTEVVGF